MISHIFILFAGIIHLYIFILESILWGKPSVNRIFGLSAEKAELNRLIAFNQGFYNLFLALAAFTGEALLLLSDQRVAGMTLILSSCLSMLGAAVVLICSQRKLIRPALIQGLPPLIGLILLAAT